MPTTLLGAGLAKKMSKIVSLSSRDSSIVHRNVKRGWQFRKDNGWGGFLQELKIEA